MSKPLPVSVTVERTISAPPDRLYGMVADVTRMSDFSPEVKAAVWLDGATEAAEGVRFKGTNSAGPNTWSTKPVITRAEPGRLFEFKVPGRSGPTWRYEFQPTTDGTRVIESVEQTRPSPLLVRLLQRRAGITDRAASRRHGMTETLDRLADAAG